MDRAEEYERQAAKAEAMAARVSDPAVREQFRDLAAQWRELALTARRGRADYAAGNDEPEK